MRRLRNHVIGVDQGEVALFSDFKDGGEMWTGRGERERRKRIAFSASYHTPPVVHVGLSMWDIDGAASSRVDLTTDGITCDGFDLVFRTWGDTRIARVRVSWTAFGEMPHEDDWALY